MEPLYHETNRVIQEIQQCFQQLNVSQTTSVVENQIVVKIATVNALVDIAISNNPITPCIIIIEL